MASTFLTTLKHYTIPTLEAVGSLIYMKNMFFVLVEPVFMLLSGQEEKKIIIIYYLARTYSIIP